MVKKKRRPVALHRERQSQSGEDRLVNKALVMHIKSPELCKELGMVTDSWNPRTKEAEKVLGLCWPANLVFLANPKLMRD